MPEVNAFAAKANIIESSSITTNWVRQTTITSFQPLAVEFALTNSGWIAYRRGGIRSFGWPNKASRTGLLPVTNAATRAFQEGAIERARAFITSLGYEEKTLYMQLDPQVRLIDRFIPIYEVRWRDVTQSGDISRIVMAQVEMPKGRIMLFSLAHPVPARPDPVIPLVAEYLSRNPNQTSATIPPEMRQRVFSRILPLIRHWASVLDVPLSGVEESQVLELEYVDTPGKSLEASLELKNGVVFLFDSLCPCSGAHNELCTLELLAYYSPNRFFRYDQTVTLELYLAKSKLTESNCAAEIKAKVKKLGFFPEAMGMLQKPSIDRPNLPKGVSSTPRLFTWSNGALNDGVAVQAEIDSRTGRIEVLQFSPGALRASLNHGRTRGQ